MRAQSFFEQQMTTMLRDMIHRERKDREKQAGRPDAAPASAVLRFGP